MIDAIISIFGISHNYELFALLAAGGISVFVLFEFMQLVSFIFKKLGGF